MKNVNYTDLSQYRPDIDGLRAIAILAVILYHFSERLLPGGFAGVDIFFVISGYVVTASIFRYQSSGLSGYLTSFYAKRAKRILPNLILVVIVISLMVFLFVPPALTGTMMKSAVFSLLGVSNYYYAFNAFDYFGIGSESNPFTHMWSLAVEEQFYLIYPLLIYIIFIHFKKTHLAGLVILFYVGLVSLVFSWYLFTKDPVYVYYFMPSRFWELLAGGAVFLSQASGTSSWQSLSYWRASTWQLLGITLIGIGLVYASPTSVGFPFSSSVPAVAGTVLVILVGTAGNNPIAKILSWTPVVYIGLLSYSLYLWHWPIFTLFRWTLGLDTIIAVSICISLILIFSLASYLLVEQRFRRIKISNNQFRVIGVSLGCLVLSVYIVKFTDRALHHFSSDSYNPIAFQNVIMPKQEWPQILKDSHYKSFKDSEEEAVKRCLGKSKVSVSGQTIYMLGDSHVLVLYFMVNEAVRDSSVAVKLIHNNGIPKILDRENPRPIEFEYVSKNAQAGDLLIVSFFRGKFYENVFHIPLKYEPMDQPGVRLRYRNAMQYFSKLAEKLAMKNVNLLFINDVPQMKNPVRVQQCVIQEKFGLPNACDVSVQQSLHTRKPMTLLFVELSKKYSNVYMWDPHPLVCLGDTCRFHDERGIVMIDHNHISRKISESMANEFRSVLNDLKISTTARP